MSNGPIQRERDAWLPPRVPAPPKVGETVTLLQSAPFGFREWKVVEIPAAAGPNDVATIECVDPACPMRMTRRRVKDLMRSEHA